MMITLSAREEYLNHSIKLTEHLLNIQFTGQSIEEKEAFCEKHREEREKTADNLMTSMFDVFTGAVKVFKLNDFEWVAAKSLDEARTWYKQNITDNDAAIYNESEVANLHKFMVTIDRVAKDDVDYPVYEELQAKYEESPDSPTITIPGYDLLSVEWEGTPYLFLSEKP